MDEPTIVSTPGGPLRVSGGVPIVRKTAVTSEYDEPLTWKKSATLPASDSYALCRCGQSANKPFCDRSHLRVGFEGVDAEHAGAYPDRSKVLGGTGITVRDDRSICAHAGFCGNKVTDIWKQVDETDDSLVRLAVINEVEKCPSGAITYRFDDEDTDTEPDYPVQIAVTADGPLWVTGAISVTTSNGEKVQARPRMTLCRCGASKNKPLCDGSHWQVAFKDS